MTALLQALFTWTFESALHTVVVMFLFFNVLYWGSSVILSIVFKKLSSKSIIVSLEKKARPASLLRNEMRRSVLSITIFSLQGIFVQQGVAHGWLHMSYNLTAAAIWQVPVLFLWNELHFYFVHRLLHTRWLMRRVHRVHHESHEPTVFSTYSFHPVEAFLLGSVIFFPLAVYPFQWIALLSLPVISIFLNALGHCNFDLWPRISPKSLLKFSNRHTLHHHTAKGNYGFMLPWFDRFFGTQAISKKE